MPIFTERKLDNTTDVGLSQTRLGEALPLRIVFNLETKLLVVMVGQRDSNS